MKFILTIDTEGDNQWDHGRDLTVENIKFVPRFQILCEKYLIKPVYLVTSEICEDNFSKEIFRDYLLKGKAEIGTHLHVWTTPPFMDTSGLRFNDKSHAFATELPEDLFREKLKNITSQIEESFGQKPFSFRSGRFGFNDNIARILAENSYLVDSSVTPYTNWSNSSGIQGGRGGPDFIENSPFPYKYNSDSKLLWEIPVTILPTRFPLNKYQQIGKYYFRKVDHNLFLKLFRKILFSNQPLWLRPHYKMNMNLFNEILDESIRIQLPFLVMMFHSSELMPGCSIYRTDKEAIEKLYSLLEQFFIMIHDKKIDAITLTEAANSLTKKEVSFLKKNA